MKLPSILLVILSFTTTTISIAADAVDVSFVISKFAVTGDNPLGDDALDLLEPYLGEHSGLDRLSDASEQLTQALESQGYSFHRVILPPQELNSGTVQFEIVTFSLGDIEVSGNQHFSNANILASLPDLKTGQAPNTQRLSRSLKIANAHNAKFARVNFKQGLEDNTIDASVKVADRNPQSIFVALDNTGNDETEEIRMTAGYQHSNLFDRDHMVTASFTTAPEDTDKASQFGISYRLPLYHHGAALEFLVSESDIDSGEVADSFDVSGKGSVISALYTRPILTDGSFNHNWFIGLQDKLFENDLSFAGVPIGSDVRSRPLSLGYELGNRVNAWAINAYITVVANISGGSDNEDEDYDLTRLDAEADWSLFRFGGDYSYYFENDWRFTGRLDAQQSSEPLIPGEQFGVGGMSSLRGFEERSVLGDSGTSLRLEGWAPPLTDYSLQFVGFIDMASVELEDAQLGEDDSVSVSSVGLGLRWSWRQQLSLSLDFGSITEGVGDQEDGDSKTHFSLIYRY